MISILIRQSNVSTTFIPIQMTKYYIGDVSWRNSFEYATVSFVLVAISKEHWFLVCQFHEIVWMQFVLTIKLHINKRFQCHFQLAGRINPLENVLSGIVSIVRYSLIIACKGNPSVNKFSYSANDCVIHCRSKFDRTTPEGHISHFWVIDILYSLSIHSQFNFTIFC